MRQLPMSPSILTQEMGRAGATHWEGDTALSEACAPLKSVAGALGGEVALSSLYLFSLLAGTMLIIITVDD